MRTCFIVFVSLLSFACQEKSQKTSSGKLKTSQDQKNLKSSGTEDTTEEAEEGSGSTSSDDSLGGLFDGLLGGGDASGGGQSGTGSVGHQGALAEGLKWTPRFGASFLSFQLYVPHENYITLDSILEGKKRTDEGDIYSCPGDSALIGLRSAYDKEQADRITQAYCQSYETSYGVEVRKKNCTVHEGFLAAKDSAEFVCPDGKIMAGIRSTWDKNALDRSYDFKCCEMHTKSGEILGFVEQQDPSTEEMVPVCERYPGSPYEQGNRFRGPLDKLCKGEVLDMQTGQPMQAPTALRAILTTHLTQNFEGNKQTDRIWMLDCCVLEAQTPLPTP